jgi:DNA-directed RNA polymerase subunit RPC12/RpoP
MARSIKCPGCGTQSTLYPFDDTAFADCGELGKKNYVKCRKCGYGIIYGRYSFLLWGRVSFLPPELQGMVYMKLDRYRA